MNCIIETHGKQHFENHGFSALGGRTLTQEIKNDEYKMKLALENGINKYIILDCGKSDLDYIKESILNSRLSEMYDLYNINWLKCHEFACNSLIKIACNLWNKGFKNTTEIGKIMNLYKTTIVIYLKRGALLGWCDYNPKEIIRKNADLARKKIVRKVVQLTLNDEYIKTWESINQSENELKIHGISNVCNKKMKSKSAGGYKWMYEEDYVTQFTTKI